MSLLESRGFLSFLLLWLLRQRPMHGGQLAEELRRRRGVRPNPGTLYPALKTLEKRGLVSCCPGARCNFYELTPLGRRNLDETRRVFVCTFEDLIGRSRPRIRASRRPPSRTPPKRNR